MALRRANGNGMGCVGLASALFFLLVVAWAVYELFIPADLIVSGISANTNNRAKNERVTLSGTGSLLASVPAIKPDPSWSPPRIATGWDSVAIVFSGTTTGDPSSITDSPYFKQIRPHFFIGNGSGMADGEVVAASYWKSQARGLVPTGDGHDRPVVVCVIGDLSVARPGAKQIAAVKGVLNYVLSVTTVADSSVYALPLKGENLSLFDVDVLMRNR